MLIGSANFDSADRSREALGLRARNAQSSREDEAARGLIVDGEGDILDISPEGLAAASQTEEDDEPRVAVAPGQGDLTEEELEDVEELEQRDEEVRRHEQAHVTAGGRYVRGGASLEYTTGPDGRRYVTGGEVSIDISPGRTPQATIQKMETIQRAAVAPAQPSAQDRAVYRAAVNLESAARRELAARNREQATGGVETAPSIGAGAPAAEPLAGGAASESRRAPGLTSGIQSPASGAPVLAPSKSNEARPTRGDVLAPAVDEAARSRDGVLTPASSDVSPVVQGPPVRRLDVLA